MRLDSSVQDYGAGRAWMCSTGASGWDISGRGSSCGYEQCWQGKKTFQLHVGHKAETRTEWGLASVKATLKAGGSC